MKQSKLTHCQWGIMIVLATGVVASGCKSAGGWKMPGANMFASPEPDAATLVGKGDVPTLPESPASKYSPNSIASVGGKLTDASPKSTATAATQNNSTAYGFPGQTVSTPKAGLAASANGYQTGPYPVGSSAANQASASPYGTPSNANPSMGYGGLGTATQTPNVELPKSVTNALNTPANSVASYPPTQGSTPGYGATPSYGAAPGSGAATGYGPTTGYGSSARSGPSTGSASYPSPTYNPNAADETARVQSADYPGLPTDQMPTSGPSAGYSSLPGYPPLPGADQLSSSPSQQQPASSAYTATPPLGTSPGSTSSGFTPGTTGRSTSYDFSPNASSAPAGGRNGPSTSTSTTLPPNTATLPGQLNR